MTRVSLAACLACLAACSDDTGDAAGDYHVTTTNSTNGCNVPSWTIGDKVDATVTLAQTGNDLTASVTGLGAVILELALGGHAYAGAIHDHTISLSLYGTRTYMSGNCTYTYNSEIHAVLDGDQIDGQIEYTSQGNDNPDCAPIDGCRSIQEFTGAR